jgi:hypothetical protein
MPTVSSKEGQHLKPLQTLTRETASKWRFLVGNNRYENLDDPRHSRIWEKKRL